MSYPTEKLKNISIISTGKLDSNAAVENGKYPFFTCDPTTLRIDNWAFNTEAVLLAGNNAQGNYTAKYYFGKFNAYQRTYIIESSNTKKLNIRFLCYALNQRLGLLKTMSAGTSTKFLTIKILHGLDIPFPSIDTQNKIANFLAAYDILIENNQKQIKLLEEAAQRIYKEWFVDFRFPGYENTPLIDGIPEGWAFKSILDNNIFIFANGKITSFEGKKRYYATADVTGTTLTSDGVPISFMNRPSRAAIQPMVNSVWFARMSNSYKILNCFGESSHLAYDSIISSGFAGFTSIDGCYGFVYETIASKEFDEEKNRYATGATQVSLTNEGLKKIKVLIPTVDIAKQYSRLVEPYMLQSELLKRNCKLLSEARDRLLPKLMSGEIEV